MKNNSKIRLVKNGVFPIIHNANGEPVADPPKTGWPVSGTLQGEGKLAGTPCLFVRLSGCNLRCTWQTQDGEISICDTPYASHFPQEFEELEPSEIAGIIQQNLNGIGHIVISGGEPMMQAEALIPLLKNLNSLNLHITLETNGTIYHPEVAKLTHLFSISPKLRSSEPTARKNSSLMRKIDEKFFVLHARTRKNIQVLQQFIDSCYYDGIRKPNNDFQLKFVVSSHQEAIEIEEDFLAHLKGVRKEDVLLMPLGGTRNFMEKTTPLVARLALERRWRFTPRLQIDLFNDTHWV